MGKPLSLADRIALAKKANDNPTERAKEKKLISNIIDKSNKDSRPDLDLTLTCPRPDLDLSQTCPRVRSSIGSSLETNVPQNKSSQMTLANRQQKVYEWFLNNGLSGYFNKGIVSRLTGITHSTIRKSIAKLEKLSLIKIFEYDPISRQQRYEINTNNDITIETLLNIKAIKQENQNQDRRSSRGSSRPDPLYIERKKDLFKNLSFSDYWTLQGLTKQKFDTWIDEFDFTEEEWNNQLMFGEYEPKVTTAHSPINYFYKALQKGGLTKPEGFEFPEERRLKIQIENIKERKALLKKAEELRQKEKELADREVFLELLKDTVTIEKAIIDFENEFKFRPSLKIAVNQFKKTGKIDSTLENRLRRWLRSE